VAVGCQQEVKMTIEKDDGNPDGAGWDWDLAYTRGAPFDRIQAWKDAGWVYIGATEDGVMMTWAAPAGTEMPK
jgi:hypothetical protein